MHQEYEPLTMGLDRPEDLLSPKQRIAAIAAILSEIAWSIETESYEQDQT